MSIEAVRFPFIGLHASPALRPVLWLALDNLHGALDEDILFPALVDTGASASVAPRALCEKLGHVFEAGTSPSSASGIGAGPLRTFKHATKLTVLATPKKGGKPDRNDTVFFPLELPLSCIEQDLPFVLLGQSDFLNLFEYAQNRPEGWFSLRRL